MVGDSVSGVTYMGQCCEDDSLCGGPSLYCDVCTEPCNHGNMFLQSVMLLCNSCVGGLDLLTPLLIQP